MIPDTRLDPNSYKSRVGCGLDRCIAPTLKGARCHGSFDRTHRDEVDILLKKIQSLSNGPERNELIRACILHCCCVRHHRPLLQTDAGHRCLTTLIARHAADLDMVGVFPPDAVWTKNLSSEKVIAVTSAILERYSQHLEYFVPYVGEPGDSIKTVISRPVRDLTKRDGRVYTFYWPSHPGYVKIGYTCRRVEDRIADWAICHPGAVLSKSEWVVYPERMEGLIHLEMADHRRKIVRCNICSKGHIEWFKLPLATVNQVIEDWSEVVRREPLYDSDGCLTVAWKGRLHSLNGEITARALLDLLDAEAALEDLAITNAKLHESLAGISEVVATMERTTVTLAQPVDELIPEEAPTIDIVNNTIVSASPALPSTQPTSLVHALSTAVQHVLPAQPAIVVPRHTVQEDEILAFFADFMSLVTQAKAVDSPTAAFALQETSLLWQPVSHIPVF